MLTFQLLLVALIQGVTEFLPISSSAHLVLLGHFGDEQGPLIDIAVHVGTLFAVLLYFRADVALMVVGLGRLLRGRIDAGTLLVAKVALGTVPVVVAGFVLHQTAPALFRSVEIIAWTTLIFGILLYVADQRGGRLRRLETLPFRDALAIGLAQMLALLPGTSRSGITMTAARALGYDRPDAARFSLLLSMPTIAAAGLLLALDLAELDDPILTLSAVMAGALAFMTALLAIALMMRWLARASFTPFVVYRVVLGIALLVYVYA